VTRVVVNDKGKVIKSTPFLTGFLQTRRAIRRCGPPGRRAGDARRRVARFDDYNGILYRSATGSDAASATRRGGAIAFAALALGAASLRRGRSRSRRLKAEVCAPATPGGQFGEPCSALDRRPAGAFVATELFLFREGNRKDPQMSPIAAGLSNGDLNDLAEYFAAERPAPPKHRTAPENAAAAPALAHKFHCVQCHGPELLGSSTFRGWRGSSRTICSRSSRASRRARAPTSTAT